jgi:peptidyl-prolyl cis-trans isomerase SurA
VKTPGLALGLGVAIALAAGVRAERIDGVAAIVGNQVILVSEVDRSARAVLERLARERGGLDDKLIAEVRAQALRTLIDGKLVERFAESRELAATDQDVDAAIEGIAREEGLTADQVYAAAAQQGLSARVYRDELRRQISRMRVISVAVQPRVTVTDEDVQALYRERYAKQEPGMRADVRHILIPISPESTPEERTQLRELAERVRARAVEGGSFGQLARQFSRAPSAESGGRASFRQGEADPALATYLFELPAGQITPVIETEHGLNIFLIVDRFDPSQVKLEDVAPALRAEIAERKTTPEFERWLEELRKAAYIEVVAEDLR